MREHGVVQPLMIRAAEERDALVLASINKAAFAGVHGSLAELLGHQLNALVYPDWETTQHQELLEATADEGSSTWVAEHRGDVVGFVVIDLDPLTKIGEISLIAVDPHRQARGVGTELNRFAVDHMRRCGMTLATVATGGDPSHAPARRSYEKAGFVAIPLVRYYAAL